MSLIEEIIQSKIQPKQKQTTLVEAVINRKISAKEFIDYFESASDVDKGTCADAMKHISEKEPDILAPHIDILIKYINYKAPRVKWGLPEAIGNISHKYPDKVVSAIPYLLKNTEENKINTTVIRWCAAFSLAEIAKNNPATREQLLPVFKKIVDKEDNSGVKKVYAKVLQIIDK
jgi:hypothetical protein